jgi:arylsulfatase A-like enzyme
MSINLQRITCRHIAAFAVSFIISSAIAAGTPPARPNIVFLLADDLRWDAPGYAGNAVIRTPALDALAAQGVNFTQAFVTTPICSVSRASILTGQYARRHGVHDFTTRIGDLSQTYPALLRAAGYYTGFIGKWGIDANRPESLRPPARLFDFWAGDDLQTRYWHERACNYVTNDGTANRENNRCTCPQKARTAEGVENSGPHPLLKDPVHLETTVIPEKVRRFLDQRDPAKPFNLSISFKAPHSPLGGYSPEFSKRFIGEKMPFGASANPAEAARQPRFLRESLESPRGWRIAHEQGAASEAQNLLRDYFRLVEGMDEAIGCLMRDLQSRGLAENTVIIFSSDNGHLHGEHGFYGKWLPYEESIRVPLVVFDPRLPAANRAKTSDAMVLNIDLAPFMLELAGVEPPPAMQGLSFKPLLQEPTRPWRESFFIEHLYMHAPQPPAHIEPSEAFRTRDWKYIRYINRPGPEGEELYHFADDPLETRNRSQDPNAAAVLEMMRLKLGRERIALGRHQTWNYPAAK